MVIKPTFIFFIDHNLCPYFKIPHYLSRKFSQFQLRPKASPLHKNYTYQNIDLFKQLADKKKWTELRLNVIVLTRAKSSASFFDKMSLELCILALLVSANPIKTIKNVTLWVTKAKFNASQLFFKEDLRSQTLFTSFYPILDIRVSVEYVKNSIRPECSFVTSKLTNESTDWNAFLELV